MQLVEPLAAQKFEGSYFRNHARPDLALQFPGGVSQEQAREWRDFWSAQYGGAANAGQAIPLGAGATIVPNARIATDRPLRRFSATPIGKTSSPGKTEAPTPEPRG